MPEFTSVVETLRVDANELAHQPEVVAFMEARVEEAKARLKTNNGIPLDRPMLFTIGQWVRVGTNMECDVSIHLPEEKGTIGRFHDRMKGTP